MIYVKRFFILLCAFFLCCQTSIATPDEISQLVALSVKGDLANFQKRYVSIFSRGASKQNVNVPLLWQVARVGSTNILQFLLESGEDPNITGESVGKTPWPTPLFAAVAGNKLENVNLLVKAGADVNRLNRSNYNAFVEALTLGEYDIALLLLQNGAQFNFDPVVGLLQSNVTQKGSPMWPFLKSLIEELQSKGVVIATPSGNSVN